MIKQCISAGCIILSLMLFVSCVKPDILVSNSSALTDKTLDYSNEIESSSFSDQTMESQASETKEMRNPMLSDNLPPLTAEEQEKVNMPVPISMWGYEANGEPTLGEYYEEIFHKPLKDVTFGEVWRFNNNENPYYVPCYLVDNGTYFTHTVCEIAAEMKSIKSVQIHAGGKINEEYDWSSLYAMQWLEELILRGDNMGAIKNVPMELGKLVNLKKMDISCNIIKKLPDMFAEMQNLEYLDISYNELKDLPSSLFQLRNLKVLSISENEITNIPKEINRLLNLEVLHLDGNPLENIPDEISALDNLEELSIGFTNLGRFYMRTNSAYPISRMVSKLPDNIGKLDSLERLEINNLPITQLPDSIADLKSLKYLNITLPLEDFPESLSNLKYVNKIDISIMILRDNFFEYECGPLQRQVDEMLGKRQLNSEE